MRKRLIALGLASGGAALAAGLLLPEAPVVRGEVLPESGGAGPAAKSARRVTPGEYRSPALEPAARERGERAAEADERAASFRGEIAGLFLSSSPAEAPDDPAFGRRACRQPDLEWLPPEEAARLAPPPPAYLPPGAWAQDEGAAVACRGQVIFAFREFVLRPSGVVVEVARSVGRRAVQVPRASAARVGPGEVAGRPAALVRPLTPEGFGPSAVVIRDGTDAVRVSALDLPFEELLRIAEGVLS